LDYLNGCQSPPCKIESQLVLVNMLDEPRAGIHNVFDEDFATKGVCGAPAGTDCPDDQDLIRQEDDDRCAFSDHYPDLDKQSGSRDSRHNSRPALAI
jgi:hypothetical protein